MTNHGTVIGALIALVVDVSFSYLFDFGSPKRAIRCDRLFEPKFVLEECHPFSFIGFIRRMILQKLSHYRSSNCLHFCQMLNRHPSLSYFFGAFDMQSLDQFFQFGYVSLFPQPSRPSMFAITISILLCPLFRSHVATSRRDCRGVTSRRLIVFGLMLLVHGSDRSRGTTRWTRG